MIFPQIFPCSNYILCPDLCVNTREFDYTPVSTTGHFLLQGYMTVQRAHCALVHWSIGPLHNVLFVQSYIPVVKNAL